MYKRRVLDIGMRQVEVAVAGDRSGTHMLVARLIWPRPAIAQKISIHTVELKAGKLSMDHASWAQRTLFKETVMGTCGLEIGVTRKVTKSQAAKFIHSAYASVLTALAADIGVTGEGSAWIGLLRYPLRYLAGEVKAPSRDTPPMTALGALDLRSDQIGPAGEPLVLDVPLSAPEDVYQTTQRMRRGELAGSRKRVLKSGEPAGKVQVEIVAYN